MFVKNVVSCNCGDQFCKNYPIGSDAVCQLGRAKVYFKLVMAEALLMQMYTDIYLPTFSLCFFRLGPLYTQCAAVRTCLGPISVPEHPVEILTDAA